MAGTSPAEPRREEALAIIMEQLVHFGTSPSYEELGRAMHPPVTKNRAADLVKQLIEKGILGKTPGAQRALFICDVTQARQIILQRARHYGITVAEPMGDLQPPLPHVQLPTIPSREHRGSLQAGEPS